jgi:tight adherence protein B
MIFAALLMTFFATLLAFYFVYVPIRASIMKTSSEAADRVARELEDIFIFIPANYVYTLKFGLMGLLGVLAFLLTYNTKAPFPFIMAGALGIAGYFGPELIVVYLRHRRRKKFSEQLVDGLSMMANGLRAGFSLQQAIEMLAEEMEAPISQEFNLVMREYRVGVDLDEALWRCVRRTKDPDLELAVSAIAVTRKLGGNLAEIFERIVDMVRDRKVLAGKADALTAQGRLQAVVVGVLPYALGFFIFKINPEMIRLMWTTWTGLLCLVAVVVLDVVGYMWVRKIADIKY